MRYLLGLIFALGLTAAHAADNSVILTPGTGVTMRSKDVGSGVEAMMPILGDTSGNPLATAPGTGNSVFALPIQGVSGGVAVPVSGTLSVTGVATAANQATNGATTAHTCNISGFSELGCLGQIDDDIRSSLPLLNTTAWNTVAPYTTGTTNAATANLTGNIFVDLGKNNGTAGTASPSVLSIQGIASMTPVQVSQATASSLNATVVLAAGSANAGGVEVFDAAGTNKLNVVAASTAPVTATNTAVVVDLRPDSPGIITLGPAAVANSVPITLSSQYPTNATTTTPTPITASATGTTAATTATLAATSGKTTYLCGFSIRANATAAATGNATVTGTVTGTLNFTQFTSPLASGLGVTEPNIGSVCIAASGTNQSIAVVSAAPGTGGVVSVSAWGYQL